MIFDCLRQPSFFVLFLHILTGQPTLQLSLLQDHVPFSGNAQIAVSCSAAELASWQLLVNPALVDSSYLLVYHDVRVVCGRILE